MPEHIYRNHIIEKRGAGYLLYNAQRQVAWDVQYQQHPNYEVDLLAHVIHLPRKLGEIKQYLDQGLPLEEGHRLVYATSHAEAVAIVRPTIPVVEATATACYQWITPEPPAGVVRFRRLPKTLGDDYALNRQYFGSFHYWAGYDGRGVELWRDSCPYGYDQRFHYRYQGDVREMIIAHIEIVQEGGHWFWRLSRSGA